MERFEELLGAFGFETDAGIPHRESHVIVFCSFSFNHQVPRSIVDAAHRLCGIEEQIQNDLLELDPIAGDGGDLRQNRSANRADCAEFRFATGRLLRVSLHSNLLIR